MKKAFIDWDEIGFPLVIVAVIMLLVGVLYYEAKVECQCEKSLVDYGYILGDVSAFSASYGVDACEIQDSPAMRKQLDTFISGETSDFMRTMQSNCKAKKSRDSAFAAGFAGGMVGGMALRR